MRFLLALVACATALLGGVDAAAAKSPPVGRYDCTIGVNNIGFGTLTIKSATRYAHRGTSGTYAAGASQRTFPDGKKGWTVRFKGGSLGGFTGRWYKAGDGTPSGNYEIALKNPRNGNESIYCDRRKAR
jgi:hypothetical protein